MLSLVLASFALGRNPRISIHEVGSVEKIAKEITQQTGRPIEVRGRLASDVLIVDLDDVSPDEALKRICWSTFGKLSTSNDRTILVADADAGRDAERAYRKATDARNAKIQADVKADLLADAFDERKAAKYVKAWAELGKLTSSADIAEREKQALIAESLPSPDRRLVAGLLACSDPSDWFEPSGGSVEFTTSANPRSKPFSKGVDLVVSQFSEDTLVLAVAGRNRQQSAPVGRVKLVVAQGGLPSPGNAVAWTYGRDGKPLNMAILPLGPYAPPIAGPPKELLETIPKDAPTTLSDLSKAELVAWEKRDQDSLRERLQDPEKVDPQASLTADVWREVAKYAGKGLVLNLPDQCFVCPPDYKAMPTKLRQALISFWTPGAHVDGTCIVARPPYPHPEWGWQIPRKALGTMFRELRTGGDHLTTLAEYVHASGFPRYPADKMIFFFLAGAQDADSTNRAFWEFLCFFGGLSRSDQAAWRAGENLHFQDTAGQSGLELDRYAASNLRWETSVKRRPAPEPNEVLPQVVQETWLTSTVESDQVEVKGETKDGEPFEYPMPPDQLGVLLKTQADQFKSVLARPSAQCSLVFTSTYPGGLQSVTRFPLPQRPAVEYGPIDRLPKEILDRMNVVKGGN